MSQRFIKALSVLKKIEDAALMAIQPRFQEVCTALDRVEQDIQTIEYTVIEQRQYLQEHPELVLSYTSYFDRMNDRKRSLLNKKIILQQEYDHVFNQLTDHVRKNKSYEHLTQTIKTRIKEEEQRLEENEINDLVQSRHRYQKRED